MPSQKARRQNTFFRQQQEHQDLSLSNCTNNTKSITMDLDRDSLVYKAKLAEQAERFDEMVADMKDVARQVCISKFLTNASGLIQVV